MRRVALLLSVILLMSGCTGGKSKPADAGGSVPGTASPEPSPSAPSSSQPIDPIVASAIGQALLNGETDRLYEQMGEEMTKAVTREELGNIVPDFVKGIEKLEVKAHLALNGGEYYGWMETGGTRTITAATDKDGKILSLLLSKAEVHPDTDQTFTKTTFRLPFESEWYPFWAGENVLANYHYAVDSQRYASDLIVVKDGYSYQGDPKKNESYYAYGQKLFAPADGTVARVVNDIADNEPVGAVTTDQAAGNVVVIDHGNGEFSYLAHLQKGSARVKVGDRVKAGDWIGLCGNSGNSSEPHLHFQVSDKDDLFAGKSIRVQWANGLILRQGEPASS